MSIGQVCELWRYPVSSIGGERLQSMTVGRKGVNGDRQFALVDLKTGEVAAPEKIIRWRPALTLKARVDEGSVIVTGPFERELAVGDHRLDGIVSDHLGFACGIREVGSTLDTQAGRVVIRPRYIASPLHILTTAALAQLQATLPAATLDTRRFRPNAVVDTMASGDDWVGRSIVMGSFKATVTEPTKRCGMTMLAQPGLAEDPDILRMIVRGFGRSFGVYAESQTGGSFSVGDDVAVV